MKTLDLTTATWTPWATTRKRDGGVTRSRELMLGRHSIAILKHERGNGFAVSNGYWLRVGRQQTCTVFATMADALAPLVGKPCNCYDCENPTKRPQGAR